MCVVIQRLCPFHDPGGKNPGCNYICLMSIPIQPFRICNGKLQWNWNFYKYLDLSPCKYYSRNIPHTFLPYLRHNKLLGIGSVFRQPNFSAPFFSRPAWHNSKLSYLRKHNMQDIFKKWLPGFQTFLCFTQRLYDTWMTVNTKPCNKIWLFSTLCIMNLHFFEIYCETAV